jgi:hypothetical protein
MVSQEEILAQLDNLKKKNRRYLEPGDFREKLPVKLKTKRYGRTAVENQRRYGENLLKSSKIATDTSSTIARNREEYQNMVAQEKALAKAQKALANAKAMKRQVVKGPDNVVNVPRPVKTPQYYSVGGGGGPGRPGMSIPSGGGNPTPGLGNVSTSNVTTVRTPYGPITVNPQAADNFVGFLKALKATGYNVTSLGSHNIRNIAGTNTPSLHSYGLAIDINPSQNPDRYGQVITNLPKGIGRLAAKYGLVWGGNWNGSYKDPMHFSIPYNGTK